MSVEQTAIEIAKEYAAANGFDRDDRRAVGLVLAGLAWILRRPVRLGEGA